MAATSTTTSTDTSTTAWLRQHGRGERLVTRALQRFFDQQRRRIVAEIAGYSRPTVDLAARLIDVDKDSAALLAAIEDPIISIMAGGAVTVWGQRPKHRATKDAGPLDRFRLPQHVKDAIVATFGQLESQPYWADIQSTTAEKLTELLRKGIEGGLSGQRLAKEVNQALGGLAKWRSKAIARTETTGAFGAGHQASYDALTADGEEFQKKWLAELDGDTRQSHIDANGQLVGAQEMFEVGGESAPYPGHWSLSAANRIHCRCVSVAQFD